MSTHIITEKANRPAATKPECFYCNRPLGWTHADHCVLVKQTVRVRAIIEYDVKAPNDWDRNDVESHRNEGSWCADNMLTELDNLDGCLCGHVKFECLEVHKESFLEE